MTWLTLLAQSVPDAGLWGRLAEQVPALVVLVILVILFLKHLDKMDTRQGERETETQKTMHENTMVLSSTKDCMERCVRALDKREQR